MRILWTFVSALLVTVTAIIGIYLIVTTFPYRYNGSAEGADFYLQHRHNVAEVYAAEPIEVTASDCDPFVLNVEGNILNSRYVQELAACQGGGFIAQFTVQESRFFLNSGRFVHIDLDGSQSVWVQVAMNEWTATLIIMMAFMMFFLAYVFFFLGASY